MIKYFKTNYVDFKYAIGKTDIFGKKFHNYYEIYMLIEGNVEFINSHIRKKVNPYEIIIIHPGEYHQFVIMGDEDGYKRCVLNIDPGFLNGDVLAKTLKGKEFLFPDKKDRIINNFLYLKECLPSVDKEDCSHILPSVACDILFLIKNHKAKVPVTKQNFSKISLELMKYINENYTKDIDLLHLSEKFHFSVSTLCHLFKNDFGISIKKYILQKRMISANIDLQNGESAEKVCREYGFSNYSTFYRSYKKYFGISPSKTDSYNQ